MISTAFYERRNGSLAIDFNERRIAQRRNREKAASPEQRRLASQIRRYEREAFKIPVRLKIQEKEVSGYTHDISPEGLLVFSDTSLNRGTPLALNFTFGENVCHLNISGQVLFCRSVQKENQPQQAIGIKFSAIRDFEQKILTSAVQELKQNGTTQEKSLLTILISKDTLAEEVADFSIRIPRTLEERPSIIRKSCIHASKIIGWGSYLPPKEITNKDISSMVKANGYKNVGEVVEALTGIKSRRYAGSEVYPSDLAAMSAKNALKNAGMDPKDIDVIIFCGVSRDLDEPATANIVQEKIGAKNAYGFDISNACNGFISGLDVADSLIVSGRCENVLVTVGETISHYIDWEPRSKKELGLNLMSYTLGDGGGTAVVSSVMDGDEQGIRARWFFSDASYWRLAIIPATAPHGKQFKFKSNGLGIERVALKYVPTGVEEVMKMLHWNINDITAVIPHQVGSHIIRKLFCERLRMPSQKVVWTFPLHGNVGAASMPIALCEGLQEERFKQGDKILLVGGSGGFGVGIMGLVL